MSKKIKQLNKQLPLVRHYNIETANTLLSNINVGRPVRSYFTELTPLAIYIICYSVKSVFGKYYDDINICPKIIVNGKKLKFGGLHFRGLNLFQEPDDDSIYVQFYGRSGVCCDIFYEIEEVLYAAHTGADGGWLDSVLGTYKSFRPTENDSFIDFNYNGIDKEKSYMEFLLEENGLSIDLHLEINVDKNKFKKYTRES